MIGDGIFSLIHTWHHFFETVSNKAASQARKGFCKKRKLGSVHTPRKIISWRNRKKKKEEVRSLLRCPWSPLLGKPIPPPVVTPPVISLSWVLMGLMSWPLAEEYHHGVCTTTSMVIGCCPHGTPRGTCCRNACCLKQLLSLGRSWMGMTLGVPTFGVRGLLHPCTVQPSWPTTHLQLQHSVQLPPNPPGQKDEEDSRATPSQWCSKACKAFARNEIKFKVFWQGTIESSCERGKPFQSES